LSNCCGGEEKVEAAVAHKRPSDLLLLPFVPDPHPFLLPCILLLFFLCIDPTRKKKVSLYYQNISRRVEKEDRKAKVTGGVRVL
jgi:hypothetical protein